MISTHTDSALFYIGVYITIVGCVYIASTSESIKEEISHTTLLTFSISLLATFSYILYQENEDREHKSQSMIAKACLLKIIAQIKNQKVDQATLFNNITLAIWFCLKLKHLEENVEDILDKNNRTENFILLASFLLKERLSTSWGDGWLVLGSTIEALDRVHVSENFMLSMLALYGDTLIPRITGVSQDNSQRHKARSEPKTASYPPVQEVELIFIEPSEQVARMKYHIDSIRGIIETGSTNRQLTLAAAQNIVAHMDKIALIFLFRNAKNSDAEHSEHAFFTDFAHEQQELVNYLRAQVRAFVIHENKTAPQFYDPCLIHALFPQKSRLFTCMLKDMPNEALRCVAKMAGLPLERQVISAAASKI